MKKIERKYPIGTFGYTEEKNETCHGFVYVKELDLDQLERRAEFSHNLILNILTDITYCADRHYKFKTDVLTKIEKTIREFLKELKEMKG